MHASQEWIDVAPATQFPADSMRGVEVEGRPLIICHVDGDFHALPDCCTHDGGELSSGTLTDGEILCPRHGARFDVKTGQVRAPPAYEDLTRVEVRLFQDRVQVKR
ncbi:MAG: non-heme iron oxygenase ferredoxin subunit [Magnetococcales bacterium]|nr:non-heme iron oxygenase ferredoxin subunit [Magnetococcales bacterium]